MESAENVVGFAAEKLPVTIEDIEYAVVSAARQQPVLAVLRDDKALLMAKIVLGFFAVTNAGQLPVALGIAPSACNSAEQEQLIINL